MHESRSWRGRLRNVYPVWSAVAQSDSGIVSTVPSSCSSRPSCMRYRWRGQPYMQTSCAGRSAHVSHAPSRFSSFFRAAVSQLNGIM